MKLIARILGVALCLSATVWLAPVQPSSAAARGCYSLWAESQEMGSRYRHLVVVENDCDYWLQCTVWTDVDPQPPVMVSVGPSATEKREINGGSPYPNPKAFGSCRKK